MTTKPSSDQGENKLRSYAENVTCAGNKLVVTDSHDVENNDLQGQGRTRNLHLLFHILAVSIGPTVFILPHAFDMVGYVPAIVCTACVGFFYTFNVHILLNSASVICEKHDLTNLSFAEVVRYSFENCRMKLRWFAPYAYNVMNVLMVISWTGELSFNVVFMCKSIKGILDLYIPAGVDIHWIVTYCLLPCMLISSIPGFKLSFLSAMATVIDVFFIGAVIFECYYTYDSREVIPHEPVKNLTQIPSFLATIFFTLNFTGIILPLRNDAKNREKFDSKWGTFSISVALICIINAIFGLIGYLRYGDFVKGMLTLNLPQQNLLVQLIICVYCIAIFFSYPICFLVIFEIVWKEWIKDTIVNREKTYFYECFTRVGINFVIFFCILCLPKLSWFTNIGGLICAVCDSIIVPALVQILVYYGEEKKGYRWIVVRNATIILSGLILFYFGLETFIYDLTEINR